MVEQKVLCDICKNEIYKHSPIKIQVIFTTDQDEGRAVEPYFDLDSIDICDICKSHALAGNYIYAEGAMGYNKYFFKNKAE